MNVAMPRRDRRAGGDGKGAPALNSPFRELQKLLRKTPGDGTRKPPRRAERSAAPPRPEPDVDEESLFRSATDGVVPLGPEAANRAGGRRATPARTLSARRETLEVLAELSDLVSGEGSFETSDTDEYAEGWVAGLDPRILQRLRSGEFPVQAHLDLHGHTLEEAGEAVRHFALRALRAGHRCVLVVHGRGRNSPDRRGVLKDAIKGWLSRGELARVVLAFATARARDGGAGATYVLLRRQRRPKKPFRTL